MRKPAKTVLVLPVYNEEKYIHQVVREATPYVDEVIVVDDGSTDHSFNEAQRAGATVIRHSLNLGKAGALKTGADAALEECADVIVFMDSDGQHLSEDLPRLIEPLLKGEADLVIGSRMGGDKMPFVRNGGNRLLHWMVKLLYGIDIHDTQSGFRAFGSQHYPQLRWESNGYHADAEITIRAAKAELRCAEIYIKTIYNDPYKGMTMLDGLGLILQVLVWKFKL